jgi:catechol 2,3-dioxygenase-like lactoylglutathione lyase family enzyme
MAQLPSVSHVALTIRDLAVSVPWYERLLGTKPVLDEDTDSFHHTAYLLPGGTILALHQHPEPTATSASTSTGPASTTSPSGSPTGPS